MSSTTIESNLPPVLRGFAYQPFRRTKPATLDPSVPQNRVGILSSLNISECYGLGGIFLFAASLISSRFTDDKSKAVWWMILSGAFTAIFGGLGIYLRVKAGGDSVEQKAKKLYDQHSSVLTSTNSINDQILDPSLVRSMTSYVKKGREQKQGTAILFVGPPGTGKTTTATAFGDVLKKAIVETGEQDGNIEIVKISNKIFDQNIVGDLFEGTPSEKVKYALIEVAKKARENKKTPIVIFDEVAYTMFSGGETAESRSPEANKMTELLQEMKQFFPGVAIFTCNIDKDTVSRHFKDGDERLFVRTFDYPTNSDKVEKVKRIVGDKIPESELNDLEDCFKFPSKLNEIIQEGTYESPFSLDEIRLLKTARDEYAKISYRGVQKAVEEALQDYKPGNGKTFKEILTDKVLNVVVKDELSSPKEFDSLISKIQQHSSIGFEEKVKIAKEVFGTSGNRLNYERCFNPDPTLKYILDEEAKTNLSDRKLKARYNYEEEKTIREIREAYFKLSVKDIEQAAKNALAQANGRASALENNLTEQIGRAVLSKFSAAKSYEIKEIFEKVSKEEISS